MVSPPVGIVLGYVCSIILTVVILRVTAIIWPSNKQFLYGWACAIGGYGAFGLIVVIGLSGAIHETIYRELSNDSVRQLMTYTKEWQDRRISDKLKECLNDGVVTEGERTQVYNVAQQIANERLRDEIDTFKYVED